METFYGLVEGVARRLPLPLELEQRTFLVGTILIPVLTFWLSVAIYSEFHRRGWFARHQVQPDREPKPELRRRAWRLVLLNTAVILPLFVAPSYALWQACGITMVGAQFPGWLLVVLQLLAFSLIEDGLFYWGHRGFHNKKLYRKFHHIHHQYLSPRPIAALYAHPVEFVSCNLLPVAAGPILVALLGSPVHIVTVWMWYALRAVETVDGHSGFELPGWFPHKLLYGSGARVHDLHHSANHGNFASFYPHWDRICGTRIKPRERREVAQ